MNIKVYKGKLGYEQGLATITDEQLAFLDYALPAKGDLISIGSESDGTSETYKVKQVLLDYTDYQGEDYEPTYSIFVETYDWE